MKQLYSSTFKCRVFKVRNFDFDHRIRPSIVKLHDVDIVCDMPKVELYDTIIYYVREAELLSDPFTSTKDDTSSFFSINEEKAGLIESTYISTNLKVITPLSESLNRPLGRFDYTRAISGDKMSSSGTDDYIALNFEDIEDFTNLEIVREGISCILFNCKDDSIKPKYHNDFIQAADISNLKYCGILQNINLTQNYQLDAYCSFYFGIIYIPNDASTYHFSLIASSIGYMLLDDELLISQNSTDNVSAVTSSKLMNKGYHTFLIKHYASASSNNDMVRLQFKRDIDTSFVDFTTANLRAVGARVYSFPLYFDDIEKSDESFLEVPSYIVDASLNSLYIKTYRPIIILARKHSKLIQKEFNRIYYTREPDVIEHSIIKVGDISNISNPFDFPVVENGIVLECNRALVLSPYITYIYSIPVKISMFEFFDSKLANSNVYDGMQCKSFTFSIVDNVYERLNASHMRDLIDFDKCKNVENFQLVNNSDTYLRVIKKNVQAHTVIVFVDPVVVSELTVRDPIIAGTQWGVITLFRAYVKATEIVKLIDNKGEMSIIQDVEDSTLIPVHYDDLGYVPMVFDHKNIAPDVQYGSEFIMFCLNVQGVIENIQTLGNVYQVYNYDNHTIFNADYLLNYKQLDSNNKNKFKLTDKLENGTDYLFCYVGYDIIQNTVIKSDFNTVNIEVANNNDVSMTDVLVDTVLPNIGRGYTCVNEALQNMYIAGVTSTGNITDNLEEWDTNNVRLLIPNISANTSTTLTCTPGTFLNNALLNGAKELWDPFELNSSLWLDSKDVNTLQIIDGNKLEIWYDKSGNNRNATQTTAAWRPSIDAKGLVAFDLVDDRMVTSLNLQLPFTIFAVFSSTSTSTAARRAIQGGTGNWFIGPYQNRVGYYPGGWVYYGPVVTVNKLYITMAHTTSAASRFYVDGVDSATNSTPKAAPGLINLGAQGYNEPMGGQIAEIIIFNRTLLDAEIEKIEGYLAWKWIDGNVNPSLPLTHKYYNKRPTLIDTDDTLADCVCTLDLLQLPLVSVRVPNISSISKLNILALKDTTLPTPSNIDFNIPTELTLAQLTVIESTGKLRYNVEIDVDISDIKYTFSCPLRVYLASNKEALDTVGVNNDNTVTDNFNTWDGYRIRFKIPVLQGGVSTLFLIRVGNFHGIPSEFISSVQASVKHKFHFSGNLIDSSTGVAGLDNGVTYNSDKLTEYYKAAQFINNTHARLPVTTNTTDFSISFWYLTKESDVGILCLSNDLTLPSITLDFKFRINNSGYLVCQVVSAPGATLIATDKIYNDYQWHHVVVTCSSIDGLKLYIDSKQKAINTNVTGRTIETSYCYVGWSDNYFDGSIDEFRVYNKCLTSSEVDILYAIFDGTVTDTKLNYTRTGIVHKPVSRITNLSDLSSLQGTPIQIYKYIDIDETIVRGMI